MTEPTADQLVERVLDGIGGTQKSLARAALTTLHERLQAAERKNIKGRVLEEQRLRAEAAEQRLRELEEALVYIEWVWDGDRDRCPSCGRSPGLPPTGGHDGSCRTAAALSTSVAEAEA